MLDQGQKEYLKGESIYGTYKAALFWYIRVLTNEDGNFDKYFDIMKIFHSSFARYYDFEQNSNFANDPYLIALTFNRIACATVDGITVFDSGQGGKVYKGKGVFYRNRAKEFLDRIDKDHPEYKNAQLMLNGWETKPLKGLCSK